jgi:hypothetical protein
MTQWRELSFNYLKDFNLPARKDDGYGEQRQTAHHNNL